MSRWSVITVLMMLVVAPGAGRASLVDGRCGTVVVIERSGPFTIIRNFARPCAPPNVFFPPPGPRLLVPPFERHLRERFIGPPAFALPRHRIERFVTVPPLIHRPVLPPLRRQFLLRRK